MLSVIPLQVLLVFSDTLGHILLTGTQIKVKHRHSQTQFKAMVLNAAMLSVVFGEEP